jgi:hypothetical protein
MIRQSYVRMAAMGYGSKVKDYFTTLWQKPETRDERIKEYVPEVLEESLMEQRAVLSEATKRDMIVESGSRVIKELENKAPTPAIAAPLAQIFDHYGGKNLISQRALSYLLYPGSVAGTANEHPHELIASFHENFKLLIGEVEKNGCSVAAPPIKDAPEKTKEQAGAADEAAEGENKVVMQSKDEAEPLEITLFVKVVAGMALANVQYTDFASGVKCCDVALLHAKDSARIGGLYGMKAGILIRMKKYEEALEAAQKSIEASNNVQGFLHGATALSKLRRDSELLRLLEQAKESFPLNAEVQRLLAAAKRDCKLALPAPAAEQLTA